MAREGEITLQLRPLPGAPPARQSIGRLLKILKRQYGLECLAIEECPGESTIPTRYVLMMKLHRDARPHRYGADTYPTLELAIAEADRLNREQFGHYWPAPEGRQ